MNQSHVKFDDILGICGKYDDSHVYKACYDIGEKKSYFVILKKLDDSKTNEKRSAIDNASFAVFRADRLLVVKIINMYDLSTTKNYVTCQHMLCLDGIHESTPDFLPIETIYQVNKIVEAHSYDTNVDNVNSGGIYYYITPLPAFYRAINRNIYTGEYIEWYGTGMEAKKCNYVDGQLSGECILRYTNGLIMDKQHYGDLFEDEQKNKKRKRCDGDGSDKKVTDEQPQCHEEGRCEICGVNEAREICYICHHYGFSGKKKKII